MICRSKTCTVRKFHVNEMRLCASFCPFICPDVFNLNVVLSFFKLSPTLLGIVSKIVAIQHTHRRCLFLLFYYLLLFYYFTINHEVFSFAFNSKFSAIRFSRVIYHLTPLLNQLTKIKQISNHVYKGDWLLFPTLSPHMSTFRWHMLHLSLETISY